MEKFALLNIIKALTDNYAAQSGKTDEKIDDTSQVKHAPPFERANPMASIILRHEQIANRVKNR